MKFPDKVIDICMLLNEKGAKDIVVCNTTKMKNVAEYFVLATGDDIPQVKELADFIEQKVQEHNDKFGDYFREGYAQSSWVVFDLDNLFVNIFTKDEREHYSLQKLLNEGGNIYTLKRIISDIENRKKREQKEINKTKSVKKIKTKEDKK